MGLLYILILPWLVGRCCSCLLPRQRQDGGACRIQDMPTQVRHHYGHPVPFSNVAGMAPVGAHLGAQTLDGTNFSISKDNDKVTARVPIGNRTNPFAAGWQAYLCLEGEKLATGGH